MRYPRLKILAVAALAALAWSAAGRAFIEGPKTAPEWSIGQDLWKSRELSQDQRDRICSAGIEYVKARIPGAKVDHCTAHRNIPKEESGALAVVVLSSKVPKDAPMYYVYLDGSGPQWRPTKFEKVW
jgi:hypothetical protein